MTILPVRLGAATVQYVPSSRRFSQKRLRNRTVWEPQIDLRRYRVSAVVDWVEIGVELPTPSQFRYVQDHIAKTTSLRHWVVPLGPIPSSCPSFAIRIQNPHAAHLKALSAAVVVRWPGAEFWIRGVEVAVDFYAEDGTEEMRLQMVSVLQRHLMPPLAELAKEGGRPRQYRMKESSHTQRQLIHARGFGEIDGDGIISFGPKDAAWGDLMWRVQHKQTDNWNEDAPEELAPEHWRARVEVTLRGRAPERMGLETLEDLYEYPFEKLTSYFTFKLPTSPGEGATGVVERWWWRRSLELFRTTGIWATDIMSAYAHRESVRASKASYLPILNRRGRRPGPRAQGTPRHPFWPGHLPPPYSSPCFLVAYDKLNERVRQALRNLSL